MPLNNSAKLTRLMTTHNLTEADVAEILGLAKTKQRYPLNHHRTVRNWIQGISEPTFGWDVIFMAIKNKCKK